MNSGIRVHSYTPLSCRASSRLGVCRPHGQQEAPPIKARLPGCCLARRRFGFAVDKERCARDRAQVGPRQYEQPSRQEKVSAWADRGSPAPLRRGEEEGVEVAPQHGRDNVDDVAEARVGGIDLRAADVCTPHGPISA